MFLVRAEHGESNAQIQVALRYLKGVGVDSSYFQGELWLLKAARRGDVHAQFYLGDRYESGADIPLNLPEAARWYRAAAESAYAPAQLALGLLYSGGEGVAQNDSLALVWTRAAAEQGLAAAQHYVGFFLCCKMPSTIAQSSEESLLWFLLATDGGFKKADAFVTMLKVELPAKQFAAGRPRADAWKKAHPPRASQ